MSYPYPYHIHVNVISIPIAYTHPHSVHIHIRSTSVSISHPPQYHVHNHNHIYVISMCVGVGLFVCLSVCLSGRWFTFSNMKKDHSHSEPTYLGQVVFSLHSTVLAQVKPHFPPLTVLLHRCGGDAAFPMQPRRYAFGLLLLVLPSQLVSQTTADTCVSYTACP